MKKIHRFLTTAIPSQEVFDIRDERIVHQVVTVLKLTPGEEIILFTNNSDDAVVAIVTATKKTLSVRRVRSIPALPSSGREVIAAVCIPKRDTFELIVQKLTELGVQAIVPLISQRTVKQSVRIDRLQTISDEALEQCGGNRQVLIHEPMSVAACRSRYTIPAILFDANGSASVPTEQSCIMYIGPEGGWSDDELQLFADTTTVSLADRILRTETAAIIGAYTLLWN